LTAGKLFPTNIHWENYHFTYSKKLKQTDNTIVLPFVILCTIKNLVQKTHNLTENKERRQTTSTQQLGDTN
jgi:hypothetical protein